MTTVLDPHDGDIEYGASGTARRSMLCLAQRQHARRHRDHYR